MKRENRSHTDQHVQQANVRYLSSPMNSFYVELDKTMMPLCHADAVNNKIHVMLIVHSSINRMPWNLVTESLECGILQKVTL